MNYRLSNQHHLTKRGNAKDDGNRGRFLMCRCPISRLLVRWTTMEHITVFHAFRDRSTNIQQH